MTVSRGGWWDRQPTWLLFVLVFAVGASFLAAIVFAVVGLTWPVLDELEDWSAASESALDLNPSTTAPAGAVSQLAVGECIDDENLESYLTGGDFLLTACSEPHDYEVFLVWEFAPGPYPGDELVKDELADACRYEFESYVGRDFESSTLDFYRAWPGREVWESGARIGECLLYDFDGGTLTGSAYQSGW